MKSKNKLKRFNKSIKRGREFEQWEHRQWKGKLNELAQLESPTEWQGKRGRIDIRLVDNDEGHTIVVEIKSTNWDVMKLYRIRPNVLRHANQIWRYIEDVLRNQSVLPAIIYPASPKRLARKVNIENILNERFIQVVWRDERHG
jgi:hypothetical protein